MGRKVTWMATFAFAALGAGLAAAEPSAEDGPPNPQPGHCYVRCMTPDRYETVTEQVEVKAAATRIETVAAVYDVVEEQQLVKEASKKIIIEPAEYETVTERVVVKEASTKIVPVPAEYEKVTEQVEIAPATTRWKVRKGGPACGSKNPNDCETRCLEDVPAQYKTVTKTVIKTPATTRTVEIPAEYGTATKRVLKKPETTREVEIPAVYRTVKKRVLKTPAASNEVQIPAVHQTVTRRKLVEKGGFTAWEEAACEANIAASEHVRQIQVALGAKGYDPGPPDNVLGGKTRAALVKFQKENGLPVGGLNLKTLTALGVSQ